MNKWLIGAGAVLVVLILAAVAAILFVDVDRFKPQIRQAVLERTGRTLGFDGKLGLSFWPKLGVAVPATTLSEPGKPEQAAARLGSATVSVALLPLLKGQVVADTVHIQGLDATVERRADGTLSIDDLVGPKASAAPGAATDKPSRRDGLRMLAAIELGGLVITQSRFVFVDRKSDNTITIDGAELALGRIAARGTTPVKLALSFASARPKANGNLTLAAEVVYDLAAGSFAARGVDLIAKFDAGNVHVDRAGVKAARLEFDSAGSRIVVDALDAQASGKIGADAFETTAKAPGLSVDPVSASGQALAASVTMRGARSIDARVDASGLSGKADSLDVVKLSIDATLKESARTVRTSLTTPVRGNLAAGEWSLPKLAGNIAIEDPAVPGGTANIVLDGSAGAQTKREHANVALNANADAINLVVKADIDGFSEPHVGFDVTADKIDIDRYFPPARPASGAGPAPGADKPVGPSAGSEPPIDLTVLDSLNLDGKISIGRLTARKVQVQDLRASVKSAAGALAIAPLTAGLYEGRLDGRVDVRVKGNAMHVVTQLNNVSISPLLMDLARKDLLEGRGTVELDLNTAGANGTALKKALAGRAAVRLNDGAIRGINLAQRLRQAQSLIRSGQIEAAATDTAQKTDFTSLAVSFALTDGIATSSDLDVRSPLLRVGGDGRVDVPAGSVDYTLRASVVGSAAGQGGRELDALRGVTIPIRLTGPFDKLAWQIDWQSAGKEALKSQAAEKLKEKLAPKVDELEGRARQELEKGLKGLFGR